MEEFLKASQETSLEKEPGEIVGGIICTKKCLLEPLEISCILEKFLKKCVFEFLNKSLMEFLMGSMVEYLVQSYV